MKLSDNRVCLRWTALSAALLLHAGCLNESVNEACDKACPPGMVLGSFEASASSGCSGDVNRDRKGRSARGECIEKESCSIVCVPAPDVGESTTCDGCASADVACVPACDGRVCGDDGCGATCSGGCESETCTSDGCEAGQSCDEAGACVDENTGG